MKHSIETMQELAKSKGMKFLSTKYIGVSKNHLWLCVNGHEWNARPDNVKISAGKCNKCYGRDRIPYEKVKELIEKKGGQLLSDSFSDGRSYIKILCKNNHTWSTQVQNIWDMKWCPHCVKNHPLTIEDPRKLAIDRGGRCLSTIYVNANKPLEWECSERHRWKAKYGNVYWGNWCKQCNESLGERICKEFFEQLFKEKFTKIFPDGLVNEDGNRLEFDGYCEKLGIAFEHQGTQHFEITRKFTKTEDALIKRKKWDEIKRKFCKEQNIHLIEIPEVNKYLKPWELKQRIKDECIRAGVVLPNDFDSIVVDYNIVYKTPQWKEKLEEMKEYAIFKKGEYLSVSYKTANTKLHFRCENMHEFWTTPSKIKQRRWCPDCAHLNLGNLKRKRTFEETKRIAISNGGLCLNKEYLGGKLLYECNVGHRWEALPSSIKQGTWCRKCKKCAPLSIEEMQIIAQLKAGKCLSTKYINSQTKLLWECKEGHQWKAVPAHVKNGTWCELCARKKNRLTIEEMHELAKAKTGKCLSKVIWGSNIKLSWECKKGHKWEATPSAVKHGTWCRLCANQNNRKPL
jgi:hypothetical protein